MHYPAQDVQSLHDMQSLLPAVELRGPLQRLCPSWHVVSIVQQLRYSAVVSCGMHPMRWSHSAKGLLHRPLRNVCCTAEQRLTACLASSCVVNDAQVLQVLQDSLGQVVLQVGGLSQKALPLLSDQLCLPLLLLQLLPLCLRLSRLRQNAE